MDGQFLMSYTSSIYLGGEIISSGVWLTVDSDDFRHLPIEQGHPTRSKGVKSPQLSEELRKGMIGFENWLNKTGYPVTIFVIADQLHGEFLEWLQRITIEHDVLIGCHGLTHRSWSAWGKDKQGFSESLSQAISRIKEAVGDSYRPWFRAPAGYIAPWMAEVLSENGIELDSSVNPSWLVRRKSAGGWNNVIESMNSVGVIEKPWLTKWSLPICGPALFRFPLSIIAKRTWKRIDGKVGGPEMEQTVYWHLLDHARQNGKWFPPLRNQIAKIAPES